MTTALICIDFINEIVSENGKLAAKGYHDFCLRHNTLSNLANAQKRVRDSGGRVIHVHLGFCDDYADHPAGSPLLGAARNANILRLGTPSVGIPDGIGPNDNDIVLVKKRISAFYDTGLMATLGALNIQDIQIAGVATDLAVQSAARDAHDRDFVVSIVADSCAAASDEDHSAALDNMAKFCKIL